MEIRCVTEENQMISEAIDFLWGYWGDQSNYDFYADCIKNSTDPNKLPKFYMAYEDNKIVACYALLTNDLISRQDLYPWLACLYVSPEFREKGIGGLLLQHGIDETKRLGFDTLYLETTHTQYYERYNWTYMCHGINIGNHKVRIYMKRTSE